jgi:hypothetical protein
MLRCLWALWIDKTLYLYRDQRRVDTFRPKFAKCCLESRPTTGSSISKASPSGG